MSLQHESGAKAAENFLLRGKLRETEAALVATQHQLKETQTRLDAALRLQRPGAQRLLPLAHRHTRELSTSTTHSAHSAASTRQRESHNAPNLIAAIQKLIAGRRSLEPEDVAAGVLQAQLRGFLQRRRYRECTQLHAGVSGSVELRCGGQSVTGYVITVVRNGCCWEVSSCAAVVVRSVGGPGGGGAGGDWCVALTQAGAHRSQLTSWSSESWPKPDPKPPYPAQYTPTPTQVVHRFSEWRDLNKRLGAVLAASAYGDRTAAAPLPYFPARLPFGGASIVARRQCAPAHPTRPTRPTRPALPALPTRFASHSPRPAPTHAASPSDAKHRRASCEAQH